MDSHKHLGMILDKIKHVVIVIMILSALSVYVKQKILKQKNISFFFVPIILHHVLYVLIKIRVNDNSSLPLNNSSTLKHFLNGYHSYIVTSNKIILCKVI